VRVFDFVSRGSGPCFAVEVAGERRLIQKLETLDVEVIWDKLVSRSQRGESVHKVSSPHDCIVELSLGLMGVKRE